MGVVDNYYEQQRSLIRYLDEQGEVSLTLVASESFRKSLILSIASFFESEVGRVLEAFADLKSSGSPEVISLVKEKALNRQYHTLFDWNAANVNAFLRLFGADFKRRCNDRITGDPDLSRQLSRFVELGALRNKLVHNNYLTEPIDKTAEEIFADYQDALEGVRFLESMLLAPPST